MFPIIPAQAGKTIALVAMSAAMFYITGCSSKKPAETKAPEKFQVANPALVDTVYSKEYVAEIQSVQNVELRARTAGFIEKIYVDEGQLVQAGQVLFTLSGRQLQEDLLQANARLKAAVSDLKANEVEMKNTRVLVEKNIISSSEMDLAHSKKDALQARIDEARSAIAQANVNLSYTQVRAPFSGVINRIPNKTGSLVEEGTLLTTLSNNKEVFAYFSVSEKEYLDFVRRKDEGKSGEVTLMLANNQPHPSKGQVETVESEIDRSTGSLAFRARFPNPDGVLKHGATATISINQPLHNELVVPQKSTFEVQDKLYVYVVDANNTVQLRAFTSKLRLPQLYVVEAGLSATDKVLYEGIQRVKEGDKIVPELLPWNRVASQLAVR